MSEPVLRSQRVIDGLIKSFIPGVIGISLGWGAWNGLGGQEPTKKESPRQTSEVTAQERIEQLQKSVAQLSAEVARLRRELAKLEKYRQIDYTRELILKEEDRIRSLQSELADIGAKETVLDKRLDEIEIAQRPDTIERNLAPVGSTRPEEEREAISRRLMKEKRQIQSQLETLRSNRARLTSLIANSEASIARLKQRMTELTR